MGLPWTNQEVKKIIEMHRIGYPTTQEMRDAFPRHPLASIRTRASVLHLRKTQAAQWLTRAHLYFERREIEIRSFKEIAMSCNVVDRYGIDMSGNVDNAGKLLLKCS